MPTKRQCEKQAWKVATAAWHAALKGTKEVEEEVHFLTDAVWEYVEPGFEIPLSTEEDSWYNDALNDFIGIVIPEYLANEVEYLDFESAEANRKELYDRERS